MTSNILRSHLARHRYFYAAAGLGVFVGLVAQSTLSTFAAPLAGDIFFFFYLFMVAWSASCTTPDQLRDQAKSEERR